MRRLLVELAAAALTIALGAFALEKTFESRKTPVDFVLGPLEAGGPITLLIVGNSHTAALGNDRLRGDDVTYNASVGGQDIYRGYLLLRAFLPKLPRLREVIVALDYDAVGYNLSVFNQDWQDRQYYPYTGELYHDGSLQRLLARSTFFRANRDLGAVFLARPTARDPNAVLPAGEPSASTPDGCRKRAREHSEVKFRERLIAENTAYLQRIVALGLRHKTALHFLNTPKSDCYRASYSVTTRRDGRAAILGALRGHEEMFHDYFDDEGFLPDDLLDYDHLSPAGSRKLMQHLAVRTQPPADIGEPAP